MYIATIDAGTTNTRTRIWNGGIVAAEAAEQSGVRDTAIDGHNGKLTAAIRATLQAAAQQADIAPEEIGLVLASGMLTSNVGLVEIQHIIAPSGMEDLAAAMTSRRIPSICPQPIWFVPGVKNFDAAVLPAERLEEMDIMRGEEVEVCGLIARMNLQGPAVIALPGSHNKYIALDADNRIAGCMTTIAGEMLHSLTFDTILADAVGRGFASAFDETAFLRGAAYGTRLGLGRAAFMARILNLFSGYTAREAQNYLLGLILSDDLRSLQRSALFAAYRDAPIVIAGSSVMQAAYQALLERQKRQVILASADTQAGLSGYGAIAVAQKRGLAQ